MFHTGTQTFIDLWETLPRVAGVPSRADFEPLRLGKLTPQLFSADRMGDAARLRLAGGWIEALHDRPMRGLAWSDLWAPNSRPLIAGTVVRAFREARPFVIAAEAEGLKGGLEIVLAPLRGRDGALDRLIGLYQPAAPQERRRDAVGPLTARLTLGVGAARRPSLSLAAFEGRNVA